MSEQSEPFVVRTVASYKSQKRDEISFKKGVKITVTKTNQKQFRYYGKIEQINGKQGMSFLCGRMEFNLYL